MSDSWQIPKILLPNVEGQDPIDLSSVFFYSLPMRDDWKLILPPTLYPPMEEEADKLRDLIIKEAREQADTMLTKGRSNQYPVAEIMEQHYYLYCELHEKYKGKKGKENDANGYQPGVIDDRMVRRHCGSGNGRGNPGVPRRTGTSKKRRKEDCCPVEFCLRLIPGKHWYMTRRLKKLGLHNHKRIPWTEKHRRMSTYSQEHRELLATFSDITHSGSAKLLSQEVIGTLPPSSQQLQHNYKGARNVSQAQELMDYFRNQAENGKMRLLLSTTT